MWAKRSLDPGIPTAYQTLLSDGQIQVIYLDELTDTSSSIGLRIIGLVVAREAEAVEVAKSLIGQVQKLDFIRKLSKKQNLKQFPGCQIWD